MRKFIYFEVKAFFNDHQNDHCQYKLYNFKKGHNYRYPVNSLKFVVKLDMNREEFMVAKIACKIKYNWMFRDSRLTFSLLKLTTATCGLNCNGWCVIIEMKTQQKHFRVIALLITLCKMIPFFEKVKKFLSSGHYNDRSFISTFAWFHLLFTFYNIKLVFGAGQHKLVFGRVVRSPIVSFRASVIPEGDSKQVFKVQTKRKQICVIRPPHTRY